MMEKVPPMMTEGRTTFAENIQSLPSIDHLQSMDLIDEHGALITSIENKPGKLGSLTIYAFLIGKHEEINASSAQEGLELFAEHTDTARLHRGSHPNIDLLLDVIETRKNLTAVLHVK